MTSATPKPRAGEHDGPIRYIRAPEYDRRIKNGDDFAGDAFVRWVAPGCTPDQPETLEAERDLLRDALVEAQRRLNDVKLKGRGNDFYAAIVAVEQDLRAAIAKHGR